MNVINKTISGSLLFVGCVIYFMGTIIGEKFSSSLSYNLAVSVLGIFMIGSVYFLSRFLKPKIFPVLMLLAGIGTLGVGVLGYLDWGSTIYYVFAGLGYVFFSISAIMAYRYERSPFSYMSIILGFTSLVALGLWVGNVDLGSGVMVTPILVDYPILLWLTGFGVHLIAEKNK